MTHNRFVNTALSELQEANCSPIYGYQHLPLLTLEEAVEKLIPLVHNIVDHISKAKKKCHRASILLTRDESAAIYLYSMPTSFFSSLNNALRAENRHALKPWFAFLKIFITALEKLPSIKRNIWRGVEGDVGSIFNDGETHIWWSVNSCSMDLTVVKRFLGETGTIFNIEAVHAKDISMFSTFPDEKEIVLMPGTRVRAKSQPLAFDDHLFLLHLEEENLQSESQSEPSYLFEYIKQEYKKNNRIELIINPSKSFPIQQSYINLAIVETKEQREKEKKLLGAKLTHEIIGTYEEIYDIKTEIKIKNIFGRCIDQTKNILILGRAGIGKTTFCRYVAYQWATGTIWKEYDLIIFIRLRSLTETRYPPLATGTTYSPIDLIKKEYFHQGLSEKDERLLKEQLDKSQVLWLLDGYDEIVQNIPVHLQYLFEQLLKTPHHILTSRPYLTILSYDVQLEIVGFTDDNIEKYVEQFFYQIKDEVDNAPHQVQQLLSFLKYNPRIWGIVHIPVNSELMCSLWCDTDWSETTTLTMTVVYDKMIEWLCRRHLEKQNVSSNQMSKEGVYARCHKELAFLESLAFNGMESNSIILRPKLLRIASKESACSLQNENHLLNIGILKSLDYKPIGTCIEADKNHYFVHLSFQEHFAARYLVRAINSTEDQKKKAIHFIKGNKYNRRFELLFTFASGLLNNDDDQQSMNLFWTTLLEEPLDLVGFRHVQLVVSCLEEAGCDRNLPQFQKLMNSIVKWIKYFASEEHGNVYRQIEASLASSPSLINQPEIVKIFTSLLQNDDPKMIRGAYFLICNLSVAQRNLYLIDLHLIALNNVDSTVKIRASKLLVQICEETAISEVINRLLNALRDGDDFVRGGACQALGKMGKKAATNEVINRLLNALGDRDDFVRRCACEALEEMDEKAATNEVIDGLLNALGDKDDFLRGGACKALGKMGEKAATDEVINELGNALRDGSDFVRKCACKALGKMGEKPATSKVIDGLLNALRDNDVFVRGGACETVGEIGEKAATNEVINELLNALQDGDDFMRRCAREALVKVGKKAANHEVINGLLNALRDGDNFLRRCACQALAGMGEKAATNEVINGLLNALQDGDDSVRRCACEALEGMGEKAATNEVINGLLNALQDGGDSVRRCACKALEGMGEKAATNEVINGLINALGRGSDFVRRCTREALVEMGKKAGNYEVINGLLNALRDGDDSVRRYACEALEEMGEKAATNEVINGLINALGGRSDFVRARACEALAKMGDSAANNEVINRLLNALRDKDDFVRGGACEALGKIGAKAATNEVVNGLLNALRDGDGFVRGCACEALEEMGEKAATNEVIDGLLNALGDKDDFVRGGACKALGKMGEKAATNEVINGLLNALGDTNDFVKERACGAFKNMGHKAATSEVINSLNTAVIDNKPEVRSSAWNALGKFGIKAATNEVLKNLLIALEDSTDYVRWSACAALHRMGENATNSVVINKLLVAVKNKNSEIRSVACCCLRNICEKAVTNEVVNTLIDALEDDYCKVVWFAYEALQIICSKQVSNEVIKRLVDALGSRKDEVRCSACRLLKIIGEKAATDEVISRLLDTCYDEDSQVRYVAMEAIEYFFCLLSCMLHLKENTIEKISLSINRFEWNFLEKISPEIPVKAFLSTRVSFWLPVIGRILLRQGNAITITDSSVMLYGSKEPIALSIPNKELGQEMKKGLLKWLHQIIEMSA